MENSLKSLNAVRKSSMYFQFLLINKKLVHTGIWDSRLRCPPINERRESFISAIVRETTQNSDCTRLLTVSKDFDLLKTAGRGNMKNGNDKVGIWCEGKEDTLLSCFQFLKSGSKVQKSAFKRLTILSPQMVVQSKSRKSTFCIFEFIKKTISLGPSMKTTFSCVFATQELQNSLILYTLTNFSFWPLFLQFFSIPVFFFPSSYSQMKRTLDLFDCSTASKGSVHFFQPFSLFFRLENFYCYTLNFNNSFLCVFVIQLNSFSEYFMANAVVFSSEIPTWFFFTVSISL